jgi:ketohexokinase
VDHYPPEDEKLRASRLEKRRGGNVPNTLEVVQQLLQRQRGSVPLFLLAVMPSSSSLATQQIRSSLGPRVDFSHCLYRESSSEAPSSYIIKSLATNSRTIVNYNELAEMTADEFNKAADNLSGKAMVYHFEVQNFQTKKAKIPS